jgi:ABC-type iron transport system FetAB permease component
MKLTVVAHFLLPFRYRPPHEVSAMKSLLFCTTLALALPLSAAASSIDDYTWHNRLLIVFAGQSSSPELVKQRALIADAKAGFSERDMLPIEVIGNHVQGTTDSADALRHRYHIAPDTFRVLLIGKDGGVKIDSREPVEAQRVFGTVDTMPMRREEAQKNKSKS